MVAGSEDRSERAGLGIHQRDELPKPLVEVVRVVSAHLHGVVENATILQVEAVRASVLGCLAPIVMTARDPLPVIVGPGTRSRLRGS